MAAPSSTPEDPLRYLLQCVLKKGEAHDVVNMIFSGPQKELAPEGKWVDLAPGSSYEYNGLLGALSGVLAGAPEFRRWREALKVIGATLSKSNSGGCVFNADGADGSERTYKWMQGNEPITGEPKRQYHNVAFFDPSSDRWPGRVKTFLLRPGALELVKEGLGTVEALVPAIEAVLKKVHKLFRPTTKPKSPPNPPRKRPRAVSPQPLAAQPGASTPGAPIDVSAHPFVAAFESVVAVAGNPGAAAYILRMGGMLERSFATTTEQLQAVGPNSDERFAFAHIMTARLVQVLQRQGAGAGGGGAAEVTPNALDYNGEEAHEDDAFDQDDCFVGGVEDGEYDDADDQDENENSQNAMGDDSS